jgi:hypothetical protein
MVLQVQDNPAPAPYVSFPPSLWILNIVMSTSEGQSESMRKSLTITGGCLCGDVRYSVAFPPDHDFHKAVCYPSPCLPLVP